MDKILKRSAKASQKEIEKIKARLAGSGLVGIDETGCKVNGNRHWNWVFQNNEDTLIVVNKSRATKVIDDTFENGFVNACVVHDNYSSYSSIIAHNEQLCLAHKLRDINYAIECDDTKLMKEMKQVSILFLIFLSFQRVKHTNRSSHLPNHAIRSLLFYCIPIYHRTIMQVRELSGMSK